MQRFQHVPGHAPQTARLIETLKAGVPGDTKTDEELSAIAGKNCGVSGDGYANLMTAMRFCERNHGVVWARINRAGVIRCLNETEKLATVRSIRRRVCRASKRGVRVLAAVDIEKLPETERVAHRTACAVMGSLSMFSNEDTTKKLEARKVEATIDAARMLEVFR